MAKLAQSGRGIAIEGIAVISADGMIADAAGVQPDELKLDADQRFFHDTLDAADALVHGRNSGEGGPRAAQRRRIVMTRRVPAAARDQGSERTVWWNPDGAPFDKALALLDPPARRVTVIGGTDAFGLFLESGYDVFHLSRAAHARLPGGRPLFPGVPDISPEDLLARHGLKPEPVRVLDALASLTLTTWRR